MKLSCCFPGCTETHMLGGYCRKHYYTLKTPPKPPKEEIPILLVSRPR